MALWAQFLPLVKRARNWLIRNKFDIVAHFLDGTIVVQPSVPGGQTITIDGSEFAPPEPTNFVYLPLVR